MLNIRQAFIEDISVIKKLQFQLNEYHQANLPDDFLSPEEIEQKIDLHKIIESESSIFLVAEINGQLVGLVFGELWVRKSWTLKQRKIASIEQIVVDSCFRDQGVGLALIEAFEERAISNGGEELWLEIYSFNESALALYRKVGIAPKIQLGQKALA
ncbi:Acetyltransferase YpeA [Vibrio alginolyticus]|uniref:Acetyltransferase YpeA n=1 Tax=Vibrio alginolyticus TaxID=663 RepID=A0A1W6TD18_VIBAL|nr:MULTISPECIES: GNAT family N-acetyltransferase [Vibrio]ARO98741.1 Acetyltransferase YpeA [Vibrio alginolyticus]ARP03458.1 Acetyltransferase YpeA [Vibrio alginolyticus]ARP08516.1 Acetyltransferase YpeA [Vibrio alginolyticus]ARP13591.1 Acetyltransferase YpeA [Vibrio alginolyticus]ARP18651.1 Acetyltransferase YpeA [Vibrio alginolyticus]